MLPDRASRIASFLCIAVVASGAASALQSAAPGTSQTQSGGNAPPSVGAGAATSRQGGGAAPSDDAFKMGSPAALPSGVTQEEMWPAATAEGWKKPCLVHWQRTFDDAMRVARAENRPLLVAVNMDGEIASEHFAGVRYREPETAAAMSRYVCVIASVYRHTPRDYDEEGRRVECPRFGTVTCSEHIEAERELYAKYFEEKRISPRHIVLGLDGKKSMDVYFSWDTATVFTTFRKGVEGWPEPKDQMEKTLDNLAKSADVDDRQAIERAYVTGTREVRRAILATLTTARVVDQTEVLRAGIFGLDSELASLARRALAQCDTEGALDLMAEALKAEIDPAERKLLLDAVARLGAKSPRARTLAALHSGLSLGSRHIDTQALAREYDANSVRSADVQARATAAEARPNEPGALLDLAEALIARADESSERRYQSLLLEDARRATSDAERLGANGPRLDAVVALTEADLGRADAARARAVAAVEGGLLEREGAAASPAIESGLSPKSKARVLRLFAEARQRAVRDAYRAGSNWPPEWLSDLNAAYTAISAGPLADPTPLAEYHDFLLWIGATSRANKALDDALARFPDSAVLHDRLRARYLWEGGPAALERGYSDRIARETASGNASNSLTWFAGYASLVAAEHRRRRGEFEEAAAAYGRAIASYEKSIALVPDGRDTCLHFIAVAHAGAARVALERGDLELATRELFTSLEVRPESAPTLDGLNITAVMTATMLKAKLAEAGDLERATRIQSTLDALDPKLLEPPPFEPPGSPRAGRGRARPDDRAGPTGPR